MIRLALSSGDAKLQGVLSPALGSEYSVLVESNKANLLRLIAEEQVDVLILDLDSNYSSVDEQLVFFQEVRGCRIPVIVMTDDSRRSTVIDLMQRGVYDYLSPLRYPS